MKEILQQFLELEHSPTFQRLGKGHIHQTLLVEVFVKGKKQKYVLQQINNQVFTNPLDLMQNLEEIVHHLQQRKKYPLAILTPMLTRQGELCFQSGDKNYWRLFPFFENTFTVNKVKNLKQAFHAAKAFGQFSKALSDFPTEVLVPILPDFHNSPKRYNHYKSVLQQAVQIRLESAVEVIHFVEKNAFLFDLIQQLSLPLRVVHNDTKIDNVLLKKETGEGYCVIDLDTVMPDTILADFGDMVRTFTNSEAEDSTDYHKVVARIEIFDALCKGYLSEVKVMLTLEEKENLLEGAKWIILEQCLRFLIDYLANDVYYPTKYPTHNLVRASNQMHLFQSIVQQEEEMKKQIKKSLI
ncbi:MAG: aminoglycoside phosphotransferase family protein [Bacteroidota bacterium]